MGTVTTPTATASRRPKRCQPSSTAFAGADFASRRCRTDRSGSPMKPAVARTLRLGLTGLILVMLVLFARKVNWDDTWRTMQSASLPLLIGAALLKLVSIVVTRVRWW